MVSVLDWKPCGRSAAGRFVLGWILLCSAIVMLDPPSAAANEPAAHPDVPGMSYQELLRYLLERPDSVWDDAIQETLQGKADKANRALARALRYFQSGDLRQGERLVANQLLRNEVGAGSNWLQVKLVGTASNRAGIGARVTVVADGRRQIREISGGSGLYSQNSLVAQFGLGSATVVDSLIVRWPSGIGQVVTPPPSVRTLVTVTESPGSGVDGPERKWDTALLDVLPNPFAGTTTICYSLAEGNGARLEIFNAGGRLVRVLEGQAQKAGLHSMVWDGRGESGQRIGSGSYYLRFWAGNRSWTRTIVLVR